ncbi:MAG: hypothetical protein U0M13_04995 [Desulfovibrio fairfieldensis]|nr:hypothetical protein [Desulfovibrio fairfieldensis]
MADWYDDYQAHASTRWQPTQLSPEEEQQFRQWIAASDWFREMADDVEFSGEQISNADLLEDLIGSRADYDYRGAWRAGIKPQRYEHDGRQHWPSATPDGRMLKSPVHPTAWMEYFMRSTGTDPNDLGLRTPEEARDYTRSSRRQAFGGER